MRTDPKKLTPFVRFAAQNTPCPKCGSGGVTVSKQPGRSGMVLRAECGDCGFTAEIPADPA
jgi:ribosomal protein S27AE